MTWIHKLCGVAFCLCVLAHQASAQDGAVQYEYGAPVASSSSTAYPDGDFAAQLSAAHGDIDSGACDWGWGCGGSPFRTGPGRCDDWRVGPRWTSKVDGVFLFRDETDLAALSAAATSGGVAIDPTAADTVSGNIDHGIGARLSLSAYWPQCKNYGMVISYMGVFNWDAGVYDPEVPYSGPLPDPVAVNTQKEVSYRSSIHSIEVNAQSLNQGNLHLYGGVRYILLDEEVSDVLDQSSRAPVVPPNQALGIIGDPPIDTTDIFRTMEVDNNLIGFQVGLRADRVQIFNRFFLESFVNGGAYCNFVQRTSTYNEVRTYNALDDPSTTESEAVLNVSNSTTGYKADRMRMAFVAEANVSAVYQVNNCTTGRVGYQLLSITGVEMGDSAFVGLDPFSEDLLVHGWYAGVEYRR